MALTNPRKNALAQYAPVLGAMTGGLGQAAYNELLRQMQQMATGPRSSGTTIRERGRARGKVGRKARAGQPKTGQSAPGPSYNVTRPIPVQRTIQPRFNNPGTSRAVFRDVIGISNGATAGVAASTFTLGVVTTTTFGTLSTIFPRFNANSALFRQFYLNSITFTLVSNVGDATGGSISVGIDPDNYAGAAAAFGDVVRHRCSFFADLKGAGSCTYNPMEDRKTEPQFTTQANVARDEDELSFGVLQVYSTNTVGAATNIANLMVSLDVTFYGPK